MSVDVSSEAPPTRPAAPAHIETSRLRLVAWRPEDASALRAVLDANDAHLRPWIPFMQHEPRTLDGTRAMIAQMQQAFVQGTAYRWALWCASHINLYGEVMLIDRGEAGSLELGYWMASSVVGRGLATEAARRISQVALRDLGAQTVRIRCDVKNAASNAVAAKLGAVRIGQERVHDVLPGLLQLWQLEAPV